LASGIFYGQGSLRKHPNEYIEPFLDKDITGATNRINNGTIDMGAYEY
jgi:hypothetical protein